MEREAGKEMKTSSPTRVVLADDHSIVRHAIRTIIESTGEYSVAGEADTATRAVELLNELKPDILILDISFPGKSGLEALYEIRRLPVQTNVVMLTMHDDDQKAIQAMAAGAKCYLLKNTSPQEFLAALNEVRAGRSFLPKRYEHLQGEIEKAKPHLDQLAEAGPESLRGDPLSKLSKREREIFYLLADGLPNRIIAKKLFISPRTVETHRARVLKKLNFNSTADLIRYAIRNNLLTL